MGLSLTVQTGGTDHTYSLDADELQVLYEACAGNAELRAATDVLFGGNEARLGEPRSVSCDVLSTAAARLLAAGPASLRTTIYSVLIDVLPGRFPPSSASGASGVRIDGELFMIEAGVNKCTLSRIRVNAEGRGEVVSVEDIRHMKKIVTDNQGEIGIRRRSRPARLLKLLSDVGRLLTAVRPSDDVSLTLG